MNKTPAMKALEFYNTQQVPNHGLGYSDGSIMLIDTIRTILESHDQMREALEACSQLFSEIRGDWSDPRYECREGHRIISEALAKTTTLEEKI